MKIVALMSTFCEGTLAISAMRSAAMLDGILVADGPVEGNEPDPDTITRFPDGLHVKKYFGTWPDDAGKRTWIVGEAKKLWPGELWGLWLDGDELLLWGEYLRDWLERIKLESDDDTNPIAGWPFPLVELDGSVAICAGKLIRVDKVRQYLASSSYVEFVNGARRTLGNVKYYDPVNGPVMENWRARPVLAGEPHLLHRPLLRSKGRTVERQHLAEERAYKGIVLP
jgi:hypothetical protein